jgi:hypothetical protein
MDPQGESRDGLTAHVITPLSPVSPDELRWPAARRHRRRTVRVIIGIAALVACIAGGLVSLLGAGAPVHGHTARPASRGEVILPGTLLGTGQDTSRGAQVNDREVEAKMRAGAGAEAGRIVAGIYGQLTGHGFLTVGFGLCGGCAPWPARHALLEVERALGAAAGARVFPPGRDGGALVCGWDGGGPPVAAIHCYWYDWRTIGQAIYFGGFAPSLADAAAKTNQIRAAVER